MRYHFKTFLLLSAGLLSLACGRQDKAIDASSRAEDFLNEITSQETPPMSFKVGGKDSRDIFMNMEYSINEYTDSAGIRYRTSTFKDKADGLEYAIAGKIVPDMPVVEWTCYIKNASQDTSAVISDILPADLDLDFSVEPDSAFNFFYSQGSHDGFDDFATCDSIIEPHDTIDFVTTSGFSSTRYLPFFNINKGNNYGYITGIGWSGQWKAQFIGEGGKMRMEAGMEKTALRLYPGERIRTPLIMMLFWDGSRTNAQNMLRRYLVKYSSPKPGGKELQVPVSYPCWGGATTAHHLQFIKMIKDHDLPYTNYWIDAGWFGGPHETEEYQDHRTEDWYGRVGDWRMNTVQHPNGLRPISDAAHEAGMTFLLWFEPERAIQGTPVSLEHPEWLMHLPDSYKRRDVGKWKKVEAMLLDLGIPEARAWITDFVSQNIRENNMDILRIDSNTGPLKYWKANDKPDRIGATEIHYVEGLYAFLDSLLARFPNLLIDNCAGGGHRLDLEMLRRSVALHRSDYVCYSTAKAIGCQLQTFGIMNWLPYSSTGISVKPYDSYRFRSNLNAGFNYSFVPRGPNGEYLPVTDDYPLDWFREMMLQHAAIKDCFNGDYYPLTPYSRELNVWCAYELYRPDKEKGFILAFRREECPQDSLHVEIHGLDPNAEYAVKDLDTKEERKVKGSELLKDGYTFHLSEPRSSSILTISKSN